MKKIGFVLAVFALCVIPVAQAHDGSASLEIGGVGSGFTMNIVHDPDEHPFKGLYTLTVKNTGAEAWGDFHFAITSGYGGDATSVLFTDASMGGIDPTSTQSPLTWVINNPVGGLSTIDLYFYKDPIYGGDTATFTVYTDNTAEELSWFGMCVYPTPVPEPATLAILGLGALALLRKKR